MESTAISSTIRLGRIEMQDRPRARWATLMVASLAGSLLAVPVTTGPAPAAPAAGTQCAAEAASEAKAVAMAANCGQSVAVAPLRTEFTQVVAQPDGRLRFESAVVPQRARRADGSWADVDLGLARGADGRWRPTASVADVAFSGGGTGPLITLVRGGKTLTLSWPGNLPAPQVSGEQATYPEVLPGVDLVARATRTGFTHVLVVHTPQASANPALRRIRLDAGGDAGLARSPDGSLRAHAGGVLLASAEPAVMWDSSGGQGAGRTATGGGIGERSSAAGPGDAARTAPVVTELTGDGDLVLTPDQAMLAAEPSAFPLFVDPAWSTTRSKWAYATNNGSSNSDTSVARVGLSPDTGAIYRSFFQFQTSALAYKHIESAYFQMKLDHSWSCGGTPSYLYTSASINAVPKASWGAMTLKSQLSAANSFANEAGGCGEIYPDMIVNFQGTNVTNQIQTAANGNWGSITVGYTAGSNTGGSGESIQERWKKFFPGDAKLIVDYDSKPGIPNGLRVAGVACSSEVLAIGTMTPNFSAVYPDADTTQTLSGSYEWVEVPAGGVGAITASTPRKAAPPNAPAPANGRATTAAISGAVSDKTYAFRVRATDPAPYSITGGWSAWCQFRPDTTVPPVPSMVGGLNGPGRSVVVTITVAAHDVVKFRYGWTNPPTTEVVAEHPSPGYNRAYVNVTLPKYGQNTLWARAIDATGNLGAVGSVEFKADGPSPAVARWHLQTLPGRSQADALTDQQPALNGNTGLTASGVTWPADTRLIGGQTALFSGGSTSWATASGQALDTSNSFSVAAWTRLSTPACPGQNRTAVSADGAVHSAFYLTYNCDTGKWRMRLTSADATGAQILDAVAATTAVPGRWTHVAGSWDEREQKLKLFVDGALSATVTAPAAFMTAYGSGWDAGGPLVIGRDRWNSANGGFYAGELADVQLFDRVLVNHDFLGQLASDPESGGVTEPGILEPTEVGRWDFNQATPCYLQDLAGTCEAPDGTAFNRWLALRRGASKGDGHPTGEFGLHLDDWYFPDENPQPWEATQEWARSARKTGVDPNGLTQWQSVPVLRTDQSFTVAVWVRQDVLGSNRTAVSQQGTHESGFWLGSDGTNNKWKFVIVDEDVTGSTTGAMWSQSLVEQDVWTHLTAVYDAARGHLRLHVNGELSNSAAAPFAPTHVTGPLNLGRMLYRDNFYDAWNGGIDDLYLFQGAMTDAQVETFYKTHYVAPPAG